MMFSMLRFSKTYLLATLLLFVTEVIIAFYVHDAVVRPYGGDLLIVILMYCAVMTFFKLNKVHVAIAVLVFAYIVETLQYFHFISWLGLDDSLVAHLILGSGFSWTDMVAYTLGAGLVLLIDKGA